MTMNGRQTNAPARGYLLLEVMLAGALCAVIIAGLLVQLSAGRKKNTFTTRDLTAAQLVLERMEERRHAAANVFPPGNLNDTVTALDGVYSRTATVNTPPGCPESVSNPAGGPAMSLDCRNIVVTVSYNADDPTTTPVETRGTTATTRVYEP